ncbi:3117_t:CDS:2 [Cetraspora pellucida]|uniref:3117_t:CDS:1 n=1 Tax=Cetraspora pellucida TaxID=1433469 RepID=A0ACA9LEW0_9GLOM|nr:3117_t:CDS:2 [Cetraspora pellucida]
MAELNHYRNQNEEQHIKVANIALPTVNQTEDQDITAEVPKIPFNEITNSDNIMSTKKRSSEYQLGDKKLKFIKYKNITINFNN